MKASVIAAALLPLTASASILGFNTFGESNCQGFEENVHITQGGSNAADFAGGRKSFLVLETDHTCSFTIYEGGSQSGTSFTFGTDMQVNSCYQFPSGNDANSFNVQCS